MSKMKVPFLLRCMMAVSLVADFNIHYADTLEPVTTTVAIGTAMLSAALFAGYDKVRCRLYECCDDHWITPNLTSLSLALKDKVHGQHLVLDTVIRSVRGHLNNPKPSKALALSFHGWTGGGKNFVSRLITENIFKQGMKSKYVHLYVSTYHFPHKGHIETYKDQLRSWIRGNVTLCGRAMFIFDEMDKMPPGLIDSIKPYIDHYDEINGVDYRKTIFIFLSNTGGNLITRKALEHWHSGKERSELTLKEMEDVITVGAFNEEGGFWHSTLIEKNLVTAFIPFLPLAREHVKLCAKDDLKSKSLPVHDAIVDKVADELQYFPDDLLLFSKSGCKRVSQKVDLIIELDEKLLN